MTYAGPISYLPRYLSSRRERLESMVLANRAYFPRRSKYYAWATDLMEGSITAWRYRKLEERMERFVRDNE